MEWQICYCLNCRLLGCVGFLKQQQNGCPETWLTAEGWGKEKCNHSQIHRERYCRNLNPTPSDVVKKFRHLTVIRCWFDSRWTQVWVQLRASPWIQYTINTTTGHPWGHNDNLTRFLGYIVYFRIHPWCHNDSLTRFLGYKVYSRIASVDFLCGSSY